MSAVLTNRTAPQRHRTCSRCSLPGHLSTTCARPDDGSARTIDRVGVELEGYWETLSVNGASVSGKDRARALGVEYCGSPGCSDGSLDDHVSIGSRSFLPHELQTRPGNLTSVVDQICGAFPDAINAACGMHVHLSFCDAGSASLLSRPEFPAVLRDALRAWGTRLSIPSRHAFWARVDGTDEDGAAHFCRYGHAPFNGGNITTAQTRYRAINFQSWTDNGRKTVEFRLLPMFRDVRIAASAITEIVAIVDRYLYAFGLPGQHAGQAIGPCLAATAELDPVAPRCVQSPEFAIALVATSEDRTDAGRDGAVRVPPPSALVRNPHGPVIVAAPDHSERTRPRPALDTYAREPGSVLLPALATATARIVRTIQADHSPHFARLATQGRF